MIKHSSVLSMLALMATFTHMSAAVTADPAAEAGHPINGSTQYHLTFDDEFNRFDGSRWQTSDFWGMRNNPGDYQGQWFCDPTVRPKDESLTAYNPFIVSNGIMSIVAQPTPKGMFSGPDKHPYVSGQITSAHKFTQRYGYYELRAKVPAGKGLWSRFWMLTDDGIWPGEYDIFEIMGKDPLVTHQTTHFRDVQRKHAAYGNSYKGINPTDGQFHTYGFLWEKSGVTWFVDGVATLKQINRINIPMYVLIDLVVGKDPGNLWPGNPDETNVWPTALELDYYRVYSNDPSIPCVTPEEGYTPSKLPYGFSVVTRPTVAILPAGWKAADVAKPEVKGSAGWNPETEEWMLKGAGNGDHCHFAAAPLNGNGFIDATVTSASIINSNDLRAGVAFRESWEGGTKEVSLVYRVDYKDPKITHSITLQSRENGKVVELAEVKKTDPPVTLRLVRSGNTFSGYYSTDLGRSWIDVGTPKIVEMPGAVQAGILVGGNPANSFRLSRATFENVFVTASP